MSYKVDEEFEYVQGNRKYILKVKNSNSLQNKDDSRCEYCFFRENEECVAPLEVEFDAGTECGSRYRKDSTDVFFVEVNCEILEE